MARRSSRRRAADDDLQPVKSPALIDVAPERQDANAVLPEHFGSMIAAARVGDRKCQEMDCEELGWKNSPLDTPTRVTIAAWANYMRGLLYSSVCRVGPPSANELDSKRGAGPSRNGMAISTNIGRLIREKLFL